LAGSLLIIKLKAFFSILLPKGAKNPEKLFENWKLGFPIGALPPPEHSKSKCKIQMWKWYLHY